MKKFFFVCLLFGFMGNIFGKSFEFNFTDDLGRKVSMNKPKKVAVLQGSLCSLWLISGGIVEAATSDCFSGPPRMTKEQAKAENAKWETDGFYEHESGFFEYLGADSKNVKNVGTMMNPNMELLIAAKVDFVILSVKFPAHKKIEQTLTKLRIKCAFFDYETFESYLQILELFCKINGTEKNLETFGKSQEEEIETIRRRASQKSVKPKILLLRASPASIKAKTSDSLAVGILLKELGTENIADSKKTFTENLSMEKIIAEDPEYIFVDTMGANDEKSLEMIKEMLESNSAWNGLSAVKNGKYYILPKELFHFKPGKRWAESYKVLEKILGK